MVARRGLQGAKCAINGALAALLSVIFRPLRPACHGRLVAATIICGMLNEAKVLGLLEPFALELTAYQIKQMLRYLGILLRWNSKINLTAIRDEEECITRHFGESLYLGRWVQLQGQSLDIGSGAGFPALALKIAFPNLRVTLLEPNAKKRAFLKQVARTCGMESVEVRGDRLEEFASKSCPVLYDTITARAVGHLELLIPETARCLRPGGRLCLWLGKKQARTLCGAYQAFEWRPPIGLPLTREREIWVGIRTGN